MGEDPTFWVAMVPLLILGAALYTRHFSSNYIFDEQEALLANPYVNGKSLGFFDAIHRDFWGLPADRSVGSYRPLPNFVWRGVWDVQRSITQLVGRVTHNTAPAVMQPFLYHWLNVLMHAANGAMLVVLVFALTKKRGTAWLAGVIFVSAAVLTEAVCGVVGIADVMGGMGAALALLALRFPMWGMPLGVFGAVLFGLFSKESALVCVPMVPFAALVLAPLTHPERPRRALRALLALVGSVAAFVLYVELRKKWFQSPMPSELQTALPDGAGLAQKGMRAFMVWFHQAPLPKDPLNNPLVDADTPHRIAGAMRVFWRGLVQVVFPKQLSGDYSFPQEPAPQSLYEPENVLGAVAMVGMPIASVVLWIRAMLAERSARRRLATSNGAAGLFEQLPAQAMLISVGLLWVVVSYFPHSNIPVLLPTVRAERFWYFPVIGSSLALAAAFAWMWKRSQRWWDGAPVIALFALFLVFQGTRARMHALDYKDDLVFWDATRKAVPRSAKAHLNYSVMWGARGRLDIRLEENQIAVDLAPQWPMAHIYLGDTLCRMHRTDEAWPHYAKGFELAPGDPNLIALALQCLWDESAVEKHHDELMEMSDKHPGSWLAYLAVDTLRNGKDHSPPGVDPKYRPRGYNEGPKE
ncbi:MAG: tetratricopeptide repeat protein [Deltaproteobacteria bacterium]|nr:tetratricopeptide repeat protein [Deltaproteobacteria bacterium]